MTTPTGILFMAPQAQPLSAAGQLQGSATATFYVTGTTAPTDVYSDGDLITSLGNVVTADSSGTFAPFYLDPSVVYRCQLHTAGGSLIKDVDPYVVPGLQNQAAIGEILYPRTTAESAASVTPVNYQYPPGVIDRYGTNTTPGTTDMTTALADAIMSNTVVTALAETYLFTTTAGAVLKGQRINGAGRNATILQFPNVSGIAALTFQSVSGGYDTTPPGITGCQVLGQLNTTATAGIALYSSDGGGCHGGYFEDVLVGGFTGAGVAGWLLSAHSGNGIYDNIFVNCFSGPTGGGASLINSVGWLLTTTDYALPEPNRVNNNTWVGGGAVYNTGDGVKISYGSENTFTGFDREQNGGYGFNIVGVCPDVTVVGGDSESNTLGSFYKASTSSSVSVLGGNVTEAAAGSGWNQYDHFLPGGTLAGNFGVDNVGNLTIAGTIVNITGSNPALRLNGNAAISFTTSTKAAEFAGAIGVNGNTPPAQVTGFGTPVGYAVISNYNITDAGGASSNTNKCVAQIIHDLKALGLYGA